MNQAMESSSSHYWVYVDSVLVDMSDMKTKRGTKKTNTISMDDTNINEIRIRYWYFMFLSITNVKISNKDFNWEKKYLICVSHYLDSQPQVIKFTSC
jgi:hypothetical protein